MTQNRLTLSLLLLLSVSGLSAAAESPAATAATSARVDRGAHLVATMGCHDCHTPLKLGPKGPEPDMARALSGHPAELVMPPAPVLPPGPWGWIGASTNTAFAGPWGVSFTANLTPDDETGLGRWTEEIFIKTARTGRHQGKGRPVLPPMPMHILASLSDEDLGAVFAYLRSLAPLHNPVPAPIDPPEQAEQQ